MDTPRTLDNRRFAGVALCAVLLGAIIGCADADRGADGFRVALITPGPITDGGWNTQAHDGLKRIESELQAEVRHVQSSSQAEFEGIFRDFANRGFDLVIGHGYEFSDAAAQVGPLHPATVFAITSGVTVDDNVTSLQYAIEEPAFLAGMLAGDLSESGRIGCVGGVEIPPVKSAFEAFERGAKSSRPDAEVLVSWVGSWEDVAAAYQASSALLDQGVEIIFHDADSAGLGVFNAAEERGILAIGCNRDQKDVKPNTVVASVVLDIPESLARIAREVKEGRHAGRIQRYDLASGIVRLAYNDRLRHRVSEVTRRRIALAAEQLATPEAGG